MFKPMGSRTGAGHSTDYETTRREAARQIHRLFDCYPESKSRGAGETLATELITRACKYPPEIVERAVTLALGRHDWIPVPAQFQRCLDEEMEVRHRAIERKQVLALPEPFVDRSSRPTYQQLVERCARSGLTIGKKQRLFGEREIAEFRKANNISDEQWNSIPNAK